MNRQNRKHRNGYRPVGALEQCWYMIQWWIGTRFPKVFSSRYGGED